MLVQRPEGCLSDTRLMLHVACLPTHKAVSEKNPYTAVA